jgi:pullulanase
VAAYASYTLFLNYLRIIPLVKRLNNNGSKYLMNWLFRTKNTISLYSPNSDEVCLVIDDLNVSWSMKRDARGYWKTNLLLPYTELDNVSYYFRITEKNRVKKIIDPRARRIEIIDGEYRSYFSNVNYHYLNKFFIAPPFSRIVIYETHLPALSRHHSSMVTEERHRGTYLGAASEFVLDYLQNLNVAVEFLPLQFNDKELGKDWGYYSINYHALRNDFAIDKKSVNLEVMQLVDRLHGRKIPVILDVVFNHGAELWVKAWGEDVVYRKLDNGDFCQGSGCGTSVKTESQHIRETIIETLLYLVNHFKFNGFRFDLGALHDKETMMEIAKRLPKRIYLIAEPWALSGAQWGKQEMSTYFSKTRWSIWNDDFRESGRTFINGQGDYHNRDILMRGITGSHIKDGGWAIRPQQSINYISCHDGKTLADIVNGDKQRVFLGIFLVLTSQGIPMLGEGSEMLYTKKGHDNSYNRPDLNQLNWENAHQNSELVKAVANLIALRKHFTHFRYTGHLKVYNIETNDWNINWIYPTGFPHNDNVNAIGYLLRSPRKYHFWHRDQKPLLILLNGSHSGVNFQLPEGKWKVLVDGFYILTKINGIRNIPAAKGHYHLHPGTCAMLTPK